MKELMLSIIEDAPVSVGDLWDKVFSRDVSVRFCVFQDCLELLLQRRFVEFRLGKLHRSKPTAD